MTAVLWPFSTKKEVLSELHGKFGLVISECLVFDPQKGMSSSEIRGDTNFAHCRKTVLTWRFIDSSYEKSNGSPLPSGHHHHSAFDNCRAPIFLLWLLQKNLPYNISRLFLIHGLILLNLWKTPLFGRKKFVLIFRFFVICRSKQSERVTIS